MRDPGQTDWSRVDLERLRQHLIDMNEVVLRSEVKSSQAPGGVTMDITGPPRTARAIRAMVAPHTIELDRMAEWAVRTAPIPGGLRLAGSEARAPHLGAAASVDPMRLPPTWCFCLPTHRNAVAFALQFPLRDVPDRKGIAMKQMKDVWEDA